MNEKPENPSTPRPDLAAAIRQARFENAERAEAVAELREIEIGRLSLLQSALEPVVDQAPPGVDLFDMGLAPGERPRLFIDMVAFVDMAHDRRTYRFHQDTRHGRVLIAESQRIATIVAAVTNYVARRLVERERALAADPRSERERLAAARTHRTLPIANGPAREPRPPPRVPSEAAQTAAAAKPLVIPSRRPFAKRLGDAFAVLLTTLGSLTLALLLGLGAYLAWTTRLRDLWAHWVGGG